MSMVKCIIGLVVGVIAGFIAGTTFGMIFYAPFFPGTLHGEQVDEVNAKIRFSTIAGAAMGAVSGAAIGYAVSVVEQRTAARTVAKAARNQEAAEAAARAARAIRQQVELQRRIVAVRQLCSDAQNVVLSLPTIIAAAEVALDRAETELIKPRYTTFWEAVEDATARLNSFNERLHLITECKALHQRQSADLGDLAPMFSLGNITLPDPASTHSRLLALYLQAQENRDFAWIYEQRGMAAKLDPTDGILVAGYPSLSHAIQDLGYRMVGAIEDLRLSVDFRLGSIQASLESVAAVAAEQRNALLAEIRKSGDTEATIVQQLRRDSDNRSEHERAARTMLDNLQRKQRPSTDTTFPRSSGHPS